MLFNFLRYISENLFEPVKETRSTIHSDWHSELQISPVKNLLAKTGKDSEAENLLAKTARDTGRESSYASL